MQNSNHKYLISNPINKLNDHKHNNHLVLFPNISTSFISCRCSILDQLITNSLKLKWYKSLILLLFLLLNFCKDNAFFRIQGNKWEDFDKKGDFGCKFVSLSMIFTKDVVGCFICYYVVIIPQIISPRLNTKWLIPIAGRKEKSVG